MASRPAGAHARKSAEEWSDDDRELMRADKVLRRLMERTGPIQPGMDRRGSRADPWEALARAIVGQQLSTRAAASIWNKLTDLFGGRTPEPEELLRRRPATLLKAGLSNAKVGYLRDLAARVKEGRLELNRLQDLPDEDVIAELIEIKGVGQWTAEMFLIFHLGRPDVAAVGDLGIRRAVQIAYGFEELPGPDELNRIAEKWRPHRTLASLYLWRSLANTPVVEQGK
jgi:DNA-3-methyladenine glycosylase II